MTVYCTTCRGPLGTFVEMDLVTKFSKRTSLFQCPVCNKGKRVRETHYGARAVDELSEGESRHVAGNELKATLIVGGLALLLATLVNGLPRKH